MVPWFNSDELSRIGPGLPMKLAKKSPPLDPKSSSGDPNAILKPYPTQTRSTKANATKAIIIEFTDQRFCITPP